MGFDSDMRKVTERYKRWADSNVITTDDFAHVDGLIQRHYDERARIFDDLVNTLKRDTDIQSPWDSLCDKGIDLTERLNSNIASKIPDGFRTLGMSDFYEGEKAAWQACKSGRIGLMAEVIYEIGKNDEEILKKLEEDLKKAREDAKICDDLARGTFGDVKESVRGTAAEIVAVLAAAPVAAVDMIGKVLASQAKRTVKSMLIGSAALREAGKKKKVARKILIDNAAMIDNARAQIGDENIRNIRARCEENANSWKSAGSRGDYNAADWESFARACSEVLKAKESPVLEKANNLYQVMRPNYMEALNTSFLTLMSDPSTLDTFKGQLNDETRKMFEDLAKENAVLATLRASDPTKTATQQMKEIVAELENALKELKDAIRETDELMKS